jgi:hypothetical protein
MTNAKPVNAGKKVKAGTRSTARQVRAGLIQEKNADGTPVVHPAEFEGAHGIRGAHRRSRAADTRRDENFKGGQKEE